MCGFAGYIDFNQKSSKKELIKMNDVIQHRGPDAADYYFKEKDNYKIGLGHRRLSIIDLHESSNQPMLYKDLVIVFNGEIYNYKEIKKELLDLGRTFSTKSDTEVILQSYDEWKEDCVHKFIGMFSFLILDKEKEEIIAFRDRPGVKPFHYYWHNNVFLFASEIKSFHEHSQFVKELNTDAITRFIQYGHIPTPNSIFKNVKKLENGSLLKFNFSTKNIEIKKYWNVDDYYKKPKLKISFEEAKKQTEELLKSACNYRLVSDVPVGVFLSGGYDSTLVTSLLQVTSSQKIKTFTIGVDDEKLNEATFAKETAKHLGTEHTEIYCTSQQMFDLIDDLPFYYDEPFGDSSALPTMLVSKMAKKEVTVALSADGGDEVFAGYNRYDYIPKLKQIQKISKLPLPFNFIIDKLIKNDKEAKRYKKLIEDSTSINLADILNKAFEFEDIKKLFKQSVSEEIFDLSRYKNKDIKGDLSQIMAYDYKTYLLDDILMKVDRATMSASLEGREPLLDHRIIEFAAQLPDEYKYKKGSKKHILKEIVHKYVPKKMMERPKMGFAIPVFEWLKTPLKEKLNLYLSESFIKDQSIFNFEEISSLKENVLSGADKHYQKLWYLLMFQMWYQKWMK